MLVVDDGSSRATARDVLAGTSFLFPVEVRRLPENRGIEHALNYGLAEKGGQFRFIARVDCGDVCRPDRFDLQLAHMEQHPDLMLLGGAGNYVQDGRAVFTARMPVSWRAVRRRMKVKNAFIHTTVVFRSAVVKDFGLYPLDRPAAEDYAYFRRIAASQPAWNLEEVVMDCLVDPSGISSSKRTMQLRSRLRVMCDHFDWSLLAFWGLVRALLQLATPRSFSLTIRRAVHLAFGGQGGSR